MSTQFFGEGNIGAAPVFYQFPNGNELPHRLMRLSVFFDNPIPTEDGKFKDRGGFWGPVELWNSDAEQWCTLYQKGMRVLVAGRLVREEWQDGDNTPRVTFKIAARRIGILPYRIECITMGPKSSAPPTEGGE